MTTRIWTLNIVCTLCILYLYLDMSLCASNNSPNHDGCMQSSLEENTYAKCHDYCTESGGVLFTVNHLKNNSSKFQRLLRSINETRFWIDKNETGDCMGLNLEDAAFKVSCTRKEFCICYYENASSCSNMYRTPFNVLTTRAITSTEIENDTYSVSSSPKKHTMTIIITVYVVSVVLMIIGGIAVVKIRQRRTQGLQALNEDDYEYFYPPFDVRATPMLSSGENQPHSETVHSQIMFPGFPPLAHIEETAESADQGRSTPPLPVKCGPTSIESPGGGANCRPPPGLYTPLLNPVEDSRLLTIQSDATLMELVENPVYSGYSVTTRL